MSVLSQCIEFHRSFFHLRYSLSYLLLLLLLLLELLLLFQKLNISTEFSTNFYFFFKLPKNKFMIGIESLINDSGHKNTQSLDTIIKIHNDVSASNVCHSQI